MPFFLKEQRKTSTALLLPRPCGHSQAFLSLASTLGGYPPPCLGPGTHISPHRGCSRARLQLPTALPCLAMGPTDPSPTVCPFPSLVLAWPCSHGDAWCLGLGLPWCLLLPCSWWDRRWLLGPAMPPPWEAHTIASTQWAASPQDTFDTCTKLSLLIYCNQLKSVIKKRNNNNKTVHVGIVNLLKCWEKYARINSTINKMDVN